MPALPSDCDSITALITPYASTPPPLTILTLLQSPQDIPLAPPSTLLEPPPPSSSSLPLTMLTLVLILSANYHPYTLAVSSHHASDTAPTPA
ncbi:hypothetical protein O181_040681 [Austropuccinia psidii MF-1]|uniref:Uncharacterized protein n=1 Tax=Austropuccinia psidii MF-1 TaxID=1389203 RepID=A0A9Q3HDL5_9BASI|nr:hypothetical protein [Austropuccinia psidii MF-1]